MRDVASTYNSLRSISLTDLSCRSRSVSGWCAVATALLLWKWRVVNSTMEPASREEWFGLLSDYVRNALNERLQARESAQFNRHVLLLMRSPVLSADERRQLHTSLLYIFEDFSKADKRAQAKARSCILRLSVSATSDRPLLSRRRWRRSLSTSPWLTEISTKHC